MELVIVVGILAALVALAMPYYGEQVEQSKRAAMLGNLHILKKALMDYKADLGSYPLTLNLLAQPPSSFPYVLEVPVDPTEQEGSALRAGWGYNPISGNSSYTLDPKYSNL